MVLRLLPYQKLVLRFQECEPWHQTDLDLNPISPIYWAKSSNCTVL